MGFLTDYEDNNLSYKGMVLRVNPAFDSVLNISRMYRHDEILSAQEKLETALEILLSDTKSLHRLSLREKGEVLELIFQKFVHTREKSGKGNGQRLLDFEEDGEYIFASFMQDYGIDLKQCQGRLSFKKFIALFRGLSEKTKIKEVIRIRGMEVPVPTKYNQKEIANILELKAYYALPVKDTEKKDGLDMLFRTLERMAESNNDRNQ